MPRKKKLSHTESNRKLTSANLVAQDNARYLRDKEACTRHLRDLRREYWYDPFEAKTQQDKEDAKCLKLTYSE